MRGTIEDMYCRMDDLVGKVRPFVDRDAALFVLSDHGFCAFRRGVNINAWLRDNGYLHLQNGARESGAYFEGVDWSRTRAYALGLGGFYLNIQGREAQGIVARGQEAEQIEREIIDKLGGAPRQRRWDADSRRLRDAIALSRTVSRPGAGLHGRL